MSPSRCRDQRGDHPRRVPPSGKHGPELRAAVEDACHRGNTSIHSTGSSPGFITEAIPLVLTSIQRRLDHITIDEYADLSSRNSPELLFDIMGFGQAPGTSAKNASVTRATVSALRCAWSLMGSDSP